MSKYLLIVHDESAADTITSWLDHHKSDASERWSTGLSNGRTLVIVSAGVRANIRGRTFFAGFAVSQLGSRTVFGADGWKRATRGWDDPLAAGSFIAVEWTRSEVRIKHDVFGTVPVLHGHGPGFIAVSDSLAVLADLRSRFGMVNTPHSEVLLARSGLTPRHMQNMSPDTPVREITALPVGRNAVIRVASPMMLDIDGDDFATLLASAEIEERPAFRSAGAFAAGVARSVSESTSEAFLRAGAGTDSLAVLAAASAAGALDRLPIETDSASDESDAVTALASELNLTVVHEDHGERSTGLVDWAATGLGIYDQVAPVGQPATATRRVQLDGLGGNLLRTVWGGTDADGLAQASKLDGAAGAAYASQVTKGFHALGLDLDRPYSSELFYAAYRHGIHSSTMPANGIPIRPLQQLALVAAVRSRQNDRPHEGPAADPLEVLTALLDGKLPRSRAATASAAVRTLTESAVFGGSLGPSDIAAVSVYGDPADAFVGSTRLGASVVRGLGLDLEGSEQVAARVESVLDQIDDAEVVKCYGPVLANARWHLLNRGRSPEQSGPSVGKLLSFSVFAS